MSERSSAATATGRRRPATGAPAGDGRVPLPRPPAARLRRPGWRDWRLLVGLVLVLGSVALGARVVATASGTTGVWAAADVLAPGEPVTADALRVAQVRLEDAAGAYLPADRPPPEGAVALRTVGAGELLPREALGDREALESRPVAVPVEGGLPRGLAEGGAADVWVARPDAASPGTFVEPELLVEAAPVFAVDEGAGALAVAGSATVQVLVGGSALPQLLDVLANDGAVSLVPVPGSAPGRRG